VVLAGILVVVVIPSTIHLGVLLGKEIMAPPRFLIRVQGLLEIFGYFLLVLIGVELIETLKANLKKAETYPPSLSASVISINNRD
jgi:hypothetical protein